MSAPPPLTAEERRLRGTIRAGLGLFIAGLVLSGATAIPLRAEAGLLAGWTDPATALGGWLARIHAALVETDGRYPFLAYGTDWLAFGHFVIALAFLGPLRDPVRNAWVVDFGLLACGLVVPFALLMGPLRGIPQFWRLIDCSFGLLGMVPLLACRRGIGRLAALAAAATPPSGR